MEGVWLDVASQKQVSMFRALVPAQLRSGVGMIVSRARVFTKGESDVRGLSFSQACREDLCRVLDEVLIGIY